MTTNNSSLPSDTTEQSGQRDADFFSQLGIPLYQDLIGSPEADVLIGGDAAERLVGFGGRDYAYGGGGADLFVLGDFGGSYFAQQSWNDALYIEDFTLGEDQLQLPGSADRYSSTLTDDGIWLYDQGDAIALLNGIFSFDFNSDAVTYVGPPEPVVEASPETPENSDVIIPEPVELEPVELEFVEPEPIESDTIEPEPIVEEPIEPDTIESESVVEEIVSVLPPERSDDFYSQLGIPQYEDLVGSLGEDELLGSDAAERFIGFGSNDYFYGGGGTDLFILGDFGGSYYAQQGWDDFSFIQDFTVGEDQLQLQGSASQYSTQMGYEGIWIYEQGDPIAYLVGVESLDLKSAQYVGL